MAAVTAACYTMLSLSAFEWRTLRPETLFSAPPVCMLLTLTRDLRHAQHCASEFQTGDDMLRPVRELLRC